MKVIYLWHRWLGLLLGPLVLLWFLSGLVMLFVSYPAFTDADRWSHLQTLDRARVNISPAAAWQGLHRDHAPPPAGIQLMMQQGRPQYVFLVGDHWQAVWADTAQLVQVDRDLAMRSAIAFQATPQINKVTLIDLDQWSFSGKLNPHRPLFKIALQDTAGTELYVSSRTGEVVLASTRHQRFWNWIGSVPHWVYFTELRTHRDVWRQVILWPAGAGILLSAAGLWIGIRRMRLTSHYSRQRHTPYSGLLRIHHVAGYGFGLLVFSWLFSGWLSMTPLNWLSDRSVSVEEWNAWQGMQNGHDDLQLPAQLPRGTQLLEWKRFSGQPVLIAQQAGLRQRLHPQTGQILPLLTPQALRRALIRLQPQARLISMAAIHADGDAYYRPASSAARIVRASFADNAATSYDVDRRTTEIVASHDQRSRMYRWLFTALHTWNFPGIEPYFWRKLLIVLFSIAGLTIVLTGWLRGVKRLAQQR